MSCAADQRARVQRAVRRLDDCETVVATETLRPEADPTGRWVLDFVVDAEGVPPDVLATIADEGMTVRHAAPQGSFWQALATA